MDCEKCKIDRYKELLKRRSAKIQAQAETIQELIEENEQLKEELRQICHENEMLWRFRMRGGTSDARPYKAEWEELEARLDEALDMLDLLLKVLKVLVEKEEKNV